MLILIAAMIGVLLLMLRGMRGRPGSSYSANPRRGSLLVGFVSTAAILEFSSMFGSPPFMLTVALGVGFALLGGERMRAARGIIASITGVLGTIAALIGAGAAATCTGANNVMTIAVLALTLILAGGTAVTFALVRGRTLALTPLAGFASIEFMLFLAMPLGVPLLDTAAPGLGVILAIVGAIGFGVVVGWHPEVALALGSAAIVITSVGASALWGSVCAGVDTSTAVGLVVFLLAFAATQAVLRILVRR